MRLMRYRSRGDRIAIGLLEQHGVDWRCTHYGLLGRCRRTALPGWQTCAWHVPGPARLA